MCEVKCTNNLTQSKSTPEYANMLNNHDLCIVLTNEDDTYLSIQFEYVHSTNECRLFTMRRNKNELLEDCAKRLRINIEKCFVKKCKKSIENNTTFPLNLSFYQNQKLVDMTISNEKYWLEGSEMHINGRVYVVHLNWPRVTKLNFPSRILVGFWIYPHVEILNGIIVKSTFTWFRRKQTAHSTSSNTDDDEWQEIGQEFTYLVTENDIGHELKLVCQPGDGTNIGISQQVISTGNTIVAGPSNCPFEERHQNTSHFVSKFGQFRLVSYNLLADIYADSQYSMENLFAYCPAKYISFDYRKLLILKELLGYNSDIFSLQEVDKNFFYGALQPIFHKLGYGSVFLCKEENVEGLSLMYRLNKFSCITSEDHTFADLLNNCNLFDWLKEKVQSNELLNKRICKLKNGFQLLLLEMKMEETSAKEKKQLLVVGNLHLYSKDDADHIRLLQSYICFKYIEHFTQLIQKESNYTNHTISVIIAGDFNSTPEWGVLKLVTNQRVDSTLEDFRINKQELLEDVELSHGLTLKSACGFPKYTNYTQNFVGCLDYIFYDTRHLKVIDVVPMPSHETVAVNVGIPNEKFPSDHLALVCTLEWNLSS